MPYVAVYTNVTPPHPKRKPEDPGESLIDNRKRAQVRGKFEVKEENGEQADLDRRWLVSG